MIVTVARVVDLDQFLDVFSTAGVEKRREHGCRAATVIVDPDDPERVWSIFDWDEEDYQGFLQDPEIPAIARRLGLRESPARVTPRVCYDA